MRLTIPRIQVGALPHFRMSGSFNPQTGAVPSVSVSWYARGGIFDGASIVGVGERGPEAVVPLSGQRMQPFAEAVAEGMGAGATERWLQRLYEVLIDIYGVIPEGMSDRDFARKVRAYA